MNLYVVFIFIKVKPFIKFIDPVLDRVYRDNANYSFRVRTFQEDFTKTDDLKCFPEACNYEDWCQFTSNSGNVKEYKIDSPNVR